MIRNEDYVQLSRYCFNVCMALDTAIRGADVDNLSESVKTALEDLERCAN